MKKAIKDHAGDFGAILGLLALSIVISAYILVHERLRFPLVQSAPVKMFAEMPTAQAFTPGQGQTVRVSGVEVGQIGQVQIKNGLALMQLAIQKKYQNLIHTDATALARPRTGLQDMMLELNPGTPHAPIAKAGFTIPVSQTLPEVNLDEVEASLDADTRAYLNLLVNGAGPALNDQGGKRIAGVYERFLPTHRDLARLNRAVSVRGSNLRRLVNSLQRLNTALEKKQSQIVQLVDASSIVFRAFASEDANVSRAVGDLPGTLRQTTATLAKVQAFANLLGPTATNLLPAAHALPAANAALRALARPSTPIIRDQIRPFVRAARPLVRSLRPAAVNLARGTPQLGSVFDVLNHLLNMVGFNPSGGEHSYLWWIAWQDHEARTLFSVQDPHGTFRPLFVQVSCAELESSIASIPVVGAAIINTLNLKPVQSICSSLGLAGDQASAKARGAGATSTTGARTASAAGSTTSTTGSATASAAGGTGTTGGGGSGSSGSAAAADAGGATSTTTSSTSASSTSSNNPLANLASGTNRLTGGGGH